jgi:hypothetical protein
MGIVLTAVNLNSAVRDPEAYAIILLSPVIRIESGLAIVLILGITNQLTNDLNSNVSRKLTDSPFLHINILLGRVLLFNLQEYYTIQFYKSKVPKLP